MMRGSTPWKAKSNAEYVRPVRRTYEAYRNKGDIAFGLHGTGDQSGACAGSGLFGQYPRDGD